MIVDLSLAGAGIVLLAIPFLIIVRADREARETRRAATCRANLKSLGLAIRMYADDYDDRFPPSGAWGDATLAYGKNSAVYTCPSVSPDARSSPAYAFNSNLDHVGHVRDVAVPSLCGLLWDSTTLAPNAADPGTSIAFRHYGGANVAFVDAHVKRHTALAEVSFDPRAPARPSNPPRAASPGAESPGL